MKRLLVALVLVAAMALPVIAFADSDDSSDPLVGTWRGTHPLGRGDATLWIEPDVNGVYDILLHGFGGLQAHFTATDWDGTPFADPKWPGPDPAVPGLSAGGMCIYSQPGAALVTCVDRITFEGHFVLFSYEGDGHLIAWSGPGDTDPPVDFYRADDDDDDD